MCVDLYRVLGAERTWDPILQISLMFESFPISFPAFPPLFIKKTNINFIDLSQHNTEANEAYPCPAAHVPIVFVRGQISKAFHGNPRARVTLGPGWGLDLLSPPVLPFTF